MAIFGGDGNGKYLSGVHAGSGRKTMQASSALEAFDLSKVKKTDAYNALIFDRNSPFALVLLSLSISNSIASTGDSGFSTFRSTQIRDRSSRGISNSSLRVPHR